MTVTKQERVFLVYEPAAYRQAAGLCWGLLCLIRVFRFVKMRLELNSPSQIVGLVITGHGSTPFGGVKNPDSGSSPPPSPPPSPTPTPTPPPSLPAASAPTVTISAVSSATGSITLTASVTGGTYDTLTYAWSVDSGDGSITGVGEFCDLEPAQHLGWVVSIDWGRCDGNGPRNRNAG